MITLIALSRFIAMKAKPQNQKRKENMNPLTQFKKIPILPLLIALALVAWAAGADLAAISDFNGDGHPDYVLCFRMPRRLKQRSGI